MKKIVLLLLIVLFGPCSYAQGVDGQYLDDIGERLVIIDNKMYCIARNELPLQWWERDTLAVCEIKKVGASLLEVNSVSSPSFADTLNTPIILYA